MRAAGSVAWCGLAALAVAMGIGRFAFTPILPAMQEDYGLTLGRAGRLASANYFGYLLGALSAMHGGLRQDFAIRIGLAAIALATCAMGITSSFAGWLGLRALAGFASAWVLVHVSAWALERLGAAGRPGLGGTVYSGVGVGIVVAGGACLVLSYAGVASANAWLALGGAALGVTAWLWPAVGGNPGAAPGGTLGNGAPRQIAEFWRLVFCHGAFGLGYIIPATFLPLMAKRVIADPLWFGWAWPAFGAAAVASTLLAARLSRTIGQRNVWIASNVVMALGLLSPIVLHGIAGIALAALCVGGTFMVNTMVGLQEARRVGGEHARLLMAAMTSAFAAGQVAGPLLAGWLTGMPHGFALALAAAAIALLAAAAALFKSRANGATEGRTPWTSAESRSGR